MNPFRPSVAGISILLTLLACFTGCNEKRPTYADAVQLYEAEMKELERLEKRHAELVLATQPAEAAGIDLNAARSLIGNTAADLNALNEATKGLIDPAALSKANKTAEENLKQIDALTKANEQTAKKTSEAAAKAKEAAEKELPELEQQIEKQKARVESAKAEKEALAP